jgi:hypothetical protein
MAILDAFELAGWAERIENPLRGLEFTGRSDRLDDVLANLNRGTFAGGIRFSNEGKGEYVTWHGALSTGNYS